MDGRAARATFDLGGLSDGTSVEVIDESRTLTVQAGRLVDTFAPLAVHVYRIRM
jgi:hypothetical protein